MVQEKLCPKQLRIEVENDPEGSGEWLVLDVEMKGSVDEVLASYHRFKDEWLLQLPPARRSLMRLLVNIVDS